MLPEEFTVEAYVDPAGFDCYRVCSPDGKVCSTVFSAHLIEERKIQLARLYSTTS